MEKSISQTQNLASIERNTRLLFILTGYAAIYCVLELTVWFTGDIIKTENALLVMLAVIVCSALLERFLFKNNISQLPALLGFSRPTGSSMAAAVIISALLFLCYPLITLITGYRFTLPD